MKRTIIISLFVFTILKVSFAQESGYGAGIMLGEPSGLNGKYWLDNSQAVDLGVAAGLLGDGAGFSIHADYLYHVNDLVKWKYKTPFYYGFGLRMRFPSDNKMNFGVRGTVGLLMYLKEYPMDIFLEVAPSFRLLPTTGLDIDIAIGSRYFFKI